MTITCRLGGPTRGDGLVATLPTDIGHHPLPLRPLPACPAGTPVYSIRRFAASCRRLQLVRQERELLQVLNRRDLARHGSDDLVVARMRSYELAARMQVAVPEAANLALETAATREAYGMDQPETDDFGRS